MNTLDFKNKTHIITNIFVGEHGIRRMEFNGNYSFFF